MDVVSYICSKVVTMMSCATRRPYADQENALHQVAKLVGNGSDAVDLSLMTVFKVACQIDAHIS